MQARDVLESKGSVAGEVNEVACIGRIGEAARSAKVLVIHRANQGHVAHLPFVILDDNCCVGERWRIHVHLHGVMATVGF